MSNNKDFKVKNGIQPTVYHEGLGTVVSGSEGYYLAGASYDSKSFSFASQETSPQGLTLSSDGTKMYVLGLSSDTVYQYSLSTAFDVSTASYDSVSFSVSSQETVPTGLKFKSDGSKLFVVGGTTDAVYQYSLSTSFDLSTASYDSVSFSLSSQTTSPNDIAFNTNGTKMYTIAWDGSTIRVFQYSLSTGFDLSTASYDSISFDVGNEEFDGRDLGFNSTGTKMFVVGSTADSIFQYSLSTAFDLSSASYDSISFSVQTQATSPQALSFKGDGTKVYICDSTSNTIYQYSTALNTAQLDLSTGSVFDYTPTSDVQVTLSNPAASGTVSGATLLLEGAEATGVASAFSTTIYTGNGGTQTITNGIDLAGDGGLVWTKDRDTAVYHALVDTERGGQNMLVSSETLAQTDRGSDFITSFKSDGYSIGADGLLNDTNNYVSWTFKKQSSFFDVVTYTGNGVSGRSISHSLNSDVGTILFKRTDSTSNWIVWHRSAGGAYGFLDASDAFTADSGISNPTTTAFTIESTINAGWNASGGTYVAYLFAHDTDASSLIKCGSYTGTGSAGNAVTLGWEPQWLIIKRTDAAQQWPIVDSVRGMSETGQVKQLRANSNSSESTVNDKTSPSATGFTLNDGDAEWNGSGGTYIYIAIRAESIPTITYDPTLEWPGGTAPTAPALGETDVVTFNTRDGGSTYQGVLAIDGAK